MLSGGYIKFGLANKGIAVAMLSLFIAPNQMLTSKAEGRRICMDEMNTTYIVLLTLSLCLTCIQRINKLEQDFRRHIRSSRPKRRTKRK